MNTKKSLLNQNVSLKDAIIPEEKMYIPMDRSSNNNPIGIALLVIGCMSMGACGTLVFHGCDREPMPAVIKSQCVSCHSKQGMLAYYFKKKNVKSPELMAEAVLKTRNSRLLAAMNVGGEKKTPHTAMKTGWKKQYSGAWQTHERWGKVTKHTSVTEQALIAEFALETHVAEQKDIIKGLNAYGGESDLKNGDYAKRVLAELLVVPK